MITAIFALPQKKLPPVCASLADRWYAIGVEYRQYYLLNNWRRPAFPGSFGNSMIYNLSKISCFLVDEIFYIPVTVHEVSFKYT